MIRIKGLLKIRQSNEIYDSKVFDKKLSNIEENEEILTKTKMHFKFYKGPLLRFQNTGEQINIFNLISYHI